MALIALWGIPSFSKQEKIEHITISTTTLSTSNPLAKSQNESKQAKVILESPDITTTPTLPITEEPTEIATTEAKIMRLRYVDEKGNPMPNSQVYVQQQITLKGGASIIIWGTEKRIIQDIKGAILSDKDGYFEFPLFESEGDTAYSQIYAVVPYKQVGLWPTFIPYDNPKFKEIDTVRMINSTSIPGQVIIPPGFDMRSILVNATYLKINTPVNLWELPTLQIDSKKGLRFHRYLKYQWITMDDLKFSIFQQMEASLCVRMGKDSDNGNSTVT